MLEMLDNVNKTVKDDLTVTIKKGDKLSIAAACFPVSLASAYQASLRDINVAKTHRGYFSIDKKGRVVNSDDFKRGSNGLDDVSSYELILKRKEVLLSFDEPMRFIFSHSALREPNRVQICALKYSDNAIAKQQEVGRGLRLCVNDNGERQDVEVCGSRLCEREHAYRRSERKLCGIRRGFIRLTFEIRKKRQTR